MSDWTSSVFESSELNARSLGIALLRTSANSLKNSFLIMAVCCSVNISSNWSNTSISFTLSPSTRNLCLWKNSQSSSLSTFFADAVSIISTSLPMASFIWLIYFFLLLWSSRKTIGTNPFFLTIGKTPALMMEVLPIPDLPYTIVSKSLRTRWERSSISSLRPYIIWFSWYDSSPNQGLCFLSNISLLFRFYFIYNLIDYGWYISFRNVDDSIMCLNLFR